MKFSHRAHLLFALVPVFLFAVPQSSPAQTPAAAEMRLPSGAPPPTAAQKQKFTARNARFNQDYAALLANRALTPAQKATKAKQLALDLNRDMMAILTPAQRAVVLKQRDQVTGLRQSFLKQHQSDITQINTLNAAFRKSFAPSQKQKIQGIEAQAREQVKRVQADTKSTPQARQHALDAIFRGVQSQELSVLTPTQQSQMKQIHAIQVRLGQQLSTYAKAHGQQ